MAGAAADGGGAQYGATTSDNPAVQAVLHFTADCGSGPRDQLPIAQLVEEQNDLYDWIGSSSYPSTFRTAPADHGGTTVTWTLPDKRVYQYTISQDGQYLSYDNMNASGTGCLLSHLMR